MEKRTKVPTEQLSEETRHLYDVLNEEKDLAVILIASSFLDACLKSMLEHRLLDSSVTERILDHRGILGTLSARADLCYVLGLIPKRAYQDLTTVAQIRNIIAHHHLTQSFDNADIAAKCATLDAISLGETEPSMMAPRVRFTLCVTLMANMLLVNALRLKSQSKVTPPKEPTRVRFVVDGSQS